MSSDPSPPMIKTQITEMLGIRHPIIMGGMTGVGDVKLALAVSRAGGLGMIAIHNAGSPEASRAWIRELKAANVPFGVNLTILPTMGKPPPYMEYAKVIAEEGVKVVETAGSSPQKFIKFFKSHGIITIHKCVAIRHALAAERYGVDIISLDGSECAGHPGEEDVGNFVLQARGAQALSKPFLCSGGVGTGSQLAAALALGADGINCGTRFCASQECNWPESFKRRVLEAKETDTVLVLRTLKNTCRVIRNKVSEEVAAIEKENGPKTQFSDVAHLMSGARGQQAKQDNNPDGGIWSAGQVVGLINESNIPTCQQIIDNIMSEAHSVITKRLAGLVSRGDDQLIRSRL